MFQDQDIIIRTEAGQQFVSNNQTSDRLPRKLRTALLAVDDETRMATYRRYLKSFGDIDVMFQCLYDEGLLTVKGSRANPGAGENKSAVRKATTSGGRPSSSSSAADMAPHEFEEMMARISSAIEEKLGNDGMELLMHMETIDSFTQLQKCMPELEKMTKRINSGASTYKAIRKLIEQAA